MSGEVHDTRCRRSRARCRAVEHVSACSHRGPAVSPSTSAARAWLVIIVARLRPLGIQDASSPSGLDRAGRTGKARPGGGIFSTCSRCAS